MNTVYNRIYMYVCVFVSKAQDWKKRMLNAQPSAYKSLLLPLPCLTKYHSIYITEVVSPGEFYSQLIGKDTTQPLEGLQQDMTNFYCSELGKSYTIEQVYEGMVSVGGCGLCGRCL